MNIDKYLSNLVDNRFYKINNEQFNTASDDEIIYIYAEGVKQLKSLYKEGKDLTDAELIAQHIASSKASIHEDLKAYKFSEKEIDRRGLVERIYKNIKGAFPTLQMSYIYEQDSHQFYRIKDWLECAESYMKGSDKYTAKEIIENNYNALKDCDFLCMSKDACELMERLGTHLNTLTEQKADDDDVINDIITILGECLRD